MGKVQFQVDGLDSNTASIFNADATFDGNVDANSISIAGTDLFNLLPSGSTYANTEPSNPSIGQVWIDADSSVTPLTANVLSSYATQTYVANAISNVSIDLSTAAGANIDWNATTSQFDAVIPEVSPATSITIGSVHGLTTESGNSAIGFNTLKLATTGNGNAALGTYALENLTTSPENIAVGNFSLNAVTTSAKAGENTAIGVRSLKDLTDGFGNVALGGNSLYSLSNGGSNTSIGHASGTDLGSGSNNLFAGYQAQPSGTTVSNEITLGNSSVNRFRVPGLGIDWTSSTKPSAASWNYIGSVSSTSGSSVAFSSLNGEYKELFMTFSAVIQSGKDYPIFRINGDSNSSNYEMMATRTNGGTTYNLHPIFTNGFPTLDIAFYNSNGSLHIKNANSTGYKGTNLSYNGMISSYITGTYIYDLNGIYAGGYLGSSAVSSINVSLSGGSFSSGYWKLWGLK